MKATLSIVFFFLSSFLLINAQNLALNFKQYTVNDGLASNEVYQIFKDKKGLLWFATDGGISKFDGKKFKNFNRSNGLKENTIFGFYEDFEGKMWYRGTNALIGYIKNDSVFNLSIVDTLKSLAKRGVVHSIFLDKQKTLHLGFYYAKFPFATLMFPYENKDLVISDISEQDSAFMHINNFDATNYTFAAVTKSSRIDINNVYNARLKFYNAGSPTREQVFRIPYSSYANPHFYYYNKNHKELYVYRNALCKNTENGIFVKAFNTSITSCPEYFNGKFLLTFEDGKILRYDYASDRIDSIKGVVNELISHAIVDNENELWYSTTSKGVYAAKDLKVQTFKISDESVLDFKMISNQRLLVLMGNGKVLLYNRNGFKLLNQIDLIRHNSKKIAVAITTSREFKFLNDTTYIVAGSMLEITSKNQLILNPLLQQGITKDKPIPPIPVKPLFFYNVNLILRNDFQKYKFINRSSSLPRISSICYVNNDSILYGYNNGIGIVNANLEVQPQEINSLKGTSVFSVLKAAQKFIIITNNNGIYILDRKFNVIHQIQDELFLNKIRRVNFDGKSLVINTNRGVLVFKDILNSDKFILFDSKNGLLNDETNAAALINDTLYVSTLDGINYFNIDSVVSNKPKIPLYVDYIEIDKRINYFRNDTLIDINLPHATQSIKINFLFPNFKNAKDRRYYYKLKETDTTYIEIAEDFVLLDRLTSGHLDIEVYAKTAEGIVSKNKLRLKIEIEKAFWETWWFYAFLFIGSFILIYLIIRNWVQREKLKQQEKADLKLQITSLQSQALSLQMNPHFIFNAINSIQNFILKSDSNQAYNYMTKFSQLIRKVLESSRKEVISLNEEMLILRLNCELEALRFNEDFSFEIIVSENIDLSATLLPSMTLQPYVENAIWHGLAKLNGLKHLVVQLSQLDDRVEILISDNGIGINQSRLDKLNDSGRSINKESLAMKITDQRIRNFNKKYNQNLTLEIFDKSDLDPLTNGTAVKISIPIKVNQSDTA